MSTATKYRLHSFQDFCDLIPEGQKADLIDGVIYMASPDNVEHFNINLWLANLLTDYLEATQVAGGVFGFKIAFRLGLADGPEPDLGFVAPERMHLVKKTFVDGPPDLAIEIVSPDSVERDYNKKRAQYEKAGVQEYWIIDPLESKMVSFVRGTSGRFSRARGGKDKVVSKVIPGFWVRPSWFWSPVLPKKNAALAEILKTAQK